MQSIAKRPLTKEPTLLNPATAAAKSRFMTFCTRFAVAAVFLCEFLVIFNRSLETVTGPIFVITMTFLQFTDYFYLPFAVTSVVYGALGTMFRGSLGVYLLLLPLLALRLIITKFSVKIRLTDFLIAAIGLYHIAHLYFFESGYFVTGYNNQVKKLIFMISLVLWFCYIRSLERSNNGIINKTLLALSLSIATNALASLITGNASNFDSNDRLGLSGIGGNDPNIAAMFLCIAFAVILSSWYLKNWMKAPLICILMATLITTVSISGLIGMVLILFAFLFFMNKDKRNITLFLAIILIALLVISLFPLLNISSESESKPTEYLDYYQQKLTDKLGALQSENYTDTTSGRLYLSRINLEYFSGQSAVTQLFGGISVNPLGHNVSHNSFVDILLQYGYFGLTAISLMVIYKFFSQWGLARKTGDCTLLMCKLVMLYWSFSLSLFDGNGICLWLAMLVMY